jgi:Holliday junction resolvase
MQKILISLATGQMVVNLRGHREIKPDLHIVLQSKKAEKETRQFLALLEKDSVRVEPYNENEPGQFAEFIQSLLAEFTGDQLVINFTGGRKDIAFLAMQAVLNAGGEAIYVDSDKQRLLRILDNGIATSPFNEKVRNRDILRLHGQVVEVGNSQQLPESDNTIANWLFQQRQNSAFTDAYSQLLKEFKITDRRSEKTVENRLSKNGTLTPAGHKLKLTAAHGRYTLYNPWGENQTFSLAELMFIFTGKWFEAYVFQKLKTQKVFDQLQQNVVLKNDAGKDKNEFDILGNRNGWLYYFECKSGWVGTEDIDKMASYQKLFTGRFTIPVMVSYFELKANVKTRAKEHNINVIDNIDKIERITDIFRSYKPHEL